MLASVLALTGCELLQPRGDAADDGRTMMMIADTVPLAPDRPEYLSGRAMPVPEEPSPFEAGPGKPAAMLSDIEAPRSPSTQSKAEPDEPQPIPREPIP